MSIKEIVRSFTDERWNIGFIATDLEGILNGDAITVQWLKHKCRDSWFADPFILKADNDEIVVLVEEFYKPIKRGRISRLTIDRKTMQLKKLDVVLELDTHLSFPAYKRTDDEDLILLYPENSESGQLKQYKYHISTNEIEFDKVVVDTPLADAIEYTIDGVRYLFATKHPAPNGNTLLVYRFNEAKEEFEEIQQLPFKENVARMSGNFFVLNNILYRPTQECNVQYGHAVTIQKVELSGDKFDFEEIRRMYSTHPKLNVGMHTFNVYEDLIVTDCLGFDRMWFRKILMNIGLLPKR